MPTFDELFDAVEEPPKTDAFDELWDSAPTLPPITLSPYEKARLSGMEKVQGPFGPANPQEILSLPQVLQIPASIIEQSGIPQSAEEVGADFLRRIGINPAATAGVPLPPTREEETYIPTPFEEAFPNVGRGMEEAARGFITPGTTLAAPFSGLKPVQAAFETTMAAGVPESIQALAQARTPQEITKATVETGLGLMGGAKLIKDIPSHIVPRGTEPLPKISEEVPPSGEAGEAKGGIPTPRITVKDLTPEKAQGGYSPASGQVFLDKESVSKMTPEERAALVRHELAHKIETESELWKDTDTYLWNLWERDKRHPIWDYASEVTGREGMYNDISPEVIAQLYAQDYPKGTFTVRDRPIPYEHEGENLQLPREYPIPKPLMAVLDKIESKLGIWQKKAQRSQAKVTPPSSVLGVAKPSEAPVSAAVEGGAVTPPTPQAIAEPKPPEPVEQAPSVTPPVTEGEKPIGMGGAVSSEFEPSVESPTSTKNARVDVERVKRGLPPAVQPIRKEFGEVWDRAMAKIDQDPEYPDNLINELERKPRAATDEENAVLLHRQVDLQNEYAKATRDLAQAFEDGRAEAVDSEKVRVGNLSDKLLQLYNLGKKVGTETGRGLNARKMMANEDFSLAKMTLDLRAAKGGSPLTPEQVLEIQRLHDKIAETQAAFDEHVSKSQVKISDLEKQLSEQPRFTPPIIKAAERIVSTLDTRADAARQRLREKMSRMSAGVDPTIIADLAEIGASHIAHIGLDFAKWSAEMIKDLGEWVRPHLDEAFAASQKAIDSISGFPEEAKKAVKSAFSRLSDEDKAKATIDAVKEKVEQKKPDEISFFVRRLARDFVARGVKDREQLIDAVHDVLKQAIPDITRRQTMDAISGYGDFRQLSKDDISVELRGMKGEMQQIAKLEDMAKGEPPLKSGTERRTPTETERRLIKLVNDAKYKFQVPVKDPTTQLKSALDTLKTTLKNRIADYEDRIARGDYSKKPRRELILDSEAARLKVQNERAKREFQKGVELERFKNSQPFERGAHWINKWRRGFILSSPVTLAKLTSAAVQRMIITPVEEVLGSAIGKALPGLAKRAPREGGFSPSAETLAITRGITQGMKDAWDLLKTGESDLDAMYGKTSALPGSFLDFFGRVHGALKSTTKRAEFTRSMQKRLEFARRDGIDVTDPWVQMKVGVEAYKDANRSIFLQDNRVVSAYRRFVGALEQKSKITGEVPLVGKAAATTARVLLPIVKVPTNIIAETMQYAVGSITGSARLGRAYAKGIENLKPEQADLIMRELKKGSLGAAVLLLGYFNPNAIGGYYQRGEKRKPEEAKIGSIKLYGHNVPSYVLHNPLLETLQIGATIRRVADSHTSKTSSDKKGLGEGLYAAALGLGEEVPFVREMTEVTKAFDPRAKDAFWGELGKSLLIPQLVQWTAQHYDTDWRGEPIKRSPKTTVQHIETGIPGLRQNVPKKK